MAGKRYLWLSALWLAAACPAAMARAPDWKPDRLVTLVVPYAPGGGTDATARALARRLSVEWDQAVVVENLAGADGLIGTRRVIKAAPDGYTLLMQVPSIVLTKYLPVSKGADPLAQLTPVSVVAESPAAIVVGGGVPARSVAELVAYCKAAPQPCSAGSGENISKVTAKKFASATGLSNLIIINYRGTAPIVTDMLGGQVTMAFTGITAALPHHQTGALRILATEGDKRAQALPDVPTIAQAGVPDLRSVTWYGLFAPMNTPANVTESISRAVRAAGQDADVRKAVALAGGEMTLGTPAEFAAQIQRDDAYFGELARRFPFD
jgi:tripartite-type tricarboxylate transporter receptor subunit TctC